MPPDPVNDIYRCCHKHKCFHDGLLCGSAEGMGERWISLARTFLGELC